MHLGCSGACRSGKIGRCVPVTVTFNLVQKPVKTSGLGVVLEEKATQLHWIAFNQPNNHHNNPTQVYTFFVETQSYNWHLNWSDSEGFTQIQHF